MYCKTSIIASSYYDSVVLMRVASQLKKRQDVAEVALFMGTEGNHELLAQVGLATPESKEAGPQDLIIIVKAGSDELAEQIAAEAAQLLRSRRQTDQAAADYRPRTLDRALGFLPGASLAAISVPGAYAAREAARCLDHGLHVFLFSDNVAREDEKRLKATAIERDLLLMGPDCGTAYLNGVGLGFTNVVERGRIGCVAASGTGLQAVACRIAQQGEGISHGIGVGGRDLSRDIGGIMTEYALQLLDQDPQTEVIVLLSKPPHEDVARRLQVFCATLHKPVVACFQGSTIAAEALQQVVTLDEAADVAVRLVRGSSQMPQFFDDPEAVAAQLRHHGNQAVGKQVIGLFTGGTLAKEAALLLSATLGPVSMEMVASGRHMVVDLGDDRYTIGRPHPMIAPENRTEQLLELDAVNGLEPCGVLLFDVVLGHGSHLDPAGELAQALTQLRSRSGRLPSVVVSLIGTEQDPQDLAEQRRLLEETGATVFSVNSQAARFAAMLVEPACRQTFLEKTR